MNSTQTQLLSLSKVRPKAKIDSVRAQRRTMDNKTRGMSILWEAQNYWLHMDKFRRERERNKRYCYGDQWSDRICVDGQMMKEEDYIRNQGNVPLKNNLIRRLVRNVIGVYRSQESEPTCTARDRDEQQLGETMSTILQCNMQLNRHKELSARMLEEFLISGFVACRKWYGWRDNKMDCWTDYVQPNNFFIDNHMRDFRGWDVSCVGEIHDISFDSLCQEFAKSPQEYMHLREIYSNASDKERLGVMWHDFGYGTPQSFDFLTPFDTTQCRVIEVWRKEHKARMRCHDYNNGDIYKVDIEDYQQMVVEENVRRIQQGVAAGMNRDDIPMIESEWFVDEYWYYYYITPTGEILREGETPYQHQSHPYVFKAYPFIDGEIHSFVADVIDQQRYTNRLITMYDWIMRASAKGLLLFPEECLPEGMDITEIADQWTRFNGVLVIKTKDSASGMLPQQIANNSTNIGISELLNIQMKMFEDISGVNGALQGKPGYSGMSASLYNQQTQNSTTSLLDLLDTFGGFTVDCAYKDVKNMQQFYTDRRVFNIAGKSGTTIVYDKQKISNVDFDLSIIPSTSTPAYRAMANDFLMEIWRSGQIALEDMLSVGSFPFADSLIQAIKSRGEQLAQGQTPAALPPELMQQVRQTANPQALQAMGI